MRYVIFFATAFLFLSPLQPAHAGDSVSSQELQLGDDNTKLIVDTDKDVVRIIIEDQEQAIIDTDGLHVRGDITYGGSITDHGPVGFEERLRDREEEGNE